MYFVDYFAMSYQNPASILKDYQLDPNTH